MDGQIWAIPYSLLLGIHVSIIATDKPSGDERLEGYSQGQLVRTTEYEVKSTTYIHDRRKGARGCAGILWGLVPLHPFSCGDAKLWRIGEACQL